MFHRWAALVLVLALCAMSPKNAAGQTQSTKPRGHGAGSLGKNFPNPFNPHTYIPFTVGDTTNGCADDRRAHEVSLQIVNILSQQVANPILQALGTATSSSSTASSLVGARISKLQLGCGSYQAFWDGYVQSTGREAASGVYIVLFTIDRAPAGSIRIFYAK